MTNSTSTPALSGRELARARRREMSRTGGAKINAAPTRGRAKPAKAVRNDAAAPTQSVATAPPAVASETSAVAPVAAPVANQGTGKKLSGAALSRARRAMLSKGGKSALTNSTRSAPTRPTRTRPSRAPAPSSAPVAPAPTEKPEACCDACADADSAASRNVAESASNEALDGLCEIIESSPEQSARASSSVREFCRTRRSTLSKNGKLALPGKAGIEARKSLIRNAGKSALTGKALARLSRRNRSEVGRGDKAASRPSGRSRPALEAPPKVELGTTLSGQSVSGTMVEQSEKVTGSESGGCRAITGTEYLGLEQFTKLCSATPTPQPAEAKVGVSETASGQLMTGSIAAASEKVTGAEAGGCKPVTGSEYLGNEHFQSICSTQNEVRSQPKVVEGRTGKNLPVTGADEARDNAVTGSESGSAQNVTGSEYSNVTQRTQNGSAPSKVGFSHTAAGIAVSGGESSRASGITGDKQDACGRVTGSEYVSSERLQSTCGTKPVETPAKVGVDSSQGGMKITGNLVDRDEKVTGNEPGTCQRVTGSQYDSLANKQGLCDQRSNKVSSMHTLNGRPLSGTEVSHSPKLTGDDRGNCSIVTGTEYVSQESFQQSCSQIPAAGAQKTGLSQTWNNQLVSGAQTSHAEPVTGDIRGLCNSVTGSSYSGREQTSEFCSTSAVAEGEERLRNYPATQTVSGMTPAMDERLAGNFQRGRCQAVSGTPYQGLGQQEAALCNPQTAGTHHLARSSDHQPVTRTAALAAPIENEAMAYEADFSIISPAKAAWQRQQQRNVERVHSSVYGINTAITGAANKAQGVISGTPEFRHPQEMYSAPVAAPAIAPATETLRERITGEGREDGTKITGDDWSRGGSITGTEGMFSSRRNQTQRGLVPVEHSKIGAHALKDREPMEFTSPKITDGSGGGSGTRTSAMVTLSGGARG